MRLDHYLPGYHFCERHQIIIHASPEKIFSNVMHLDLKKSKVILALFKIRGALAVLSPGSKWKGKPFSLRLAVDELIKDHFQLLEEVEKKEIVLGFAGKFWQPSGDIIKFSSAGDFIHFNREGYCKSAWNFYIEEHDGGGYALLTETRILCLGWRAKILFGCYWLTIRFFSGLIRVIMLKMTKEQAEAEKDAPEPARRV